MRREERGRGESRAEQSIMLKIYRPTTNFYQSQRRQTSAIVAIYLTRNHNDHNKCHSALLPGHGHDVSDYWRSVAGRPLIMKRHLAQKIPYPTSKDEPELAFGRSIIGRRITPFGWLLLVSELLAIYGKQQCRCQSEDHRD